MLNKSYITVTALTRPLTFVLDYQASQRWSVFVDTIDRQTHSIDLDILDLILCI
jgi:hypothetical protein